MIEQLGSHAKLPHILMPVDNSYSVDKQQTDRIGTLTSIISAPLPMVARQVFSSQDTSNDSCLNLLLKASQDKLGKRKLKHLELPDPKDESKPAIAALHLEETLLLSEQDFEETLMCGQVMALKKVKEEAALVTEKNTDHENEASCSTSKPSSSKKRKKAKDLERLDLSDCITELKRIQELCAAARKKIEDSHLNSKSKNRFVKNFKIAETALGANALLAVDPSSQLPAQRYRVNASKDKTDTVAKECFFLQKYTF